MLVFGGKTSTNENAKAILEEAKEESKRLEQIERLERKEADLLAELAATRTEIEKSSPRHRHQKSGRSSMFRSTKLKRSPRHLHSATSMTSSFRSLKPPPIDREGNQNMVNSSAGRILSPSNSNIGGTNLNNIQFPASGHYDLLPVLTTKGVEAFEVGLNQSQTPHMLPVFHLPSVSFDAEDRIQNRLPTSYNVRNAQASQLLRQQQSKDIQNALGIASSEMEKLETDLFSPQVSKYSLASGKDVLNIGHAGNSTYSATSTRSNIETNIFLDQIPLGVRGTFSETKHNLSKKQYQNLYQQEHKMIHESRRNTQKQSKQVGHSNLNIKKISKRSRQKSSGGRNSKRYKNNDLVKGGNDRSIQDVGKLRSDLLKSLQAIQDNTSAVEEGIMWVRQKCPVTSIRAQMYMKRWGLEKVKRVMMAMLSREVRLSFLCWRDAAYEAVEKEKHEEFSRLSGASRTFQTFMELYYKTLRKGFSKWKEDVQAEILREDIAMKVEYACVLQRWVRNAQARKFLRIIREARIRKEQDIAAADIQRHVRGKISRKQTDHLMMIYYRKRAACRLQLMYRKWAGRKMLRIIFETQRRNRASVHIQRVARGAAGRRRRDYMLANKYKEASTMLVQRVYRGYLGRNRVARILRDKQRVIATTIMQRRIRGMQGRKKMAQRRAEHAIYLRKLEQCAIRVQSVYRGHRGKLSYHLKKSAMRKRREKMKTSASVIQRCYRAYKSRGILGMAKDANFFKMVVDARAWVEYYDDQASKLFYFNAMTEEALWEPPSTGYTRSDGKLILYNGNEIDNPKEDETREHVEAKLKAEKQAAEGGEAGVVEQKTCIECEEIAADGICVECDDIYCENCYYSLHSKGNRAKHTWQPFKQNDGGNSTDGSVAAAVEDGYETGYETADGYETGYEETGWEENSGYEGQDTTEGQVAAIPAEGTDDPWQEVNDEEGNTYFWNSETGESAWERPVFKKLKTMMKLGLFNAASVENSAFGIDAAAGSKWVEYWDDENQCSYWWNDSTQESRYDNPNA